ncbi:hypothetical protein [Polyangium sorediatum]|uniref:Uncharacterized protein n=1 Tax=Polyangium sorediatum TaxID=889274 RepID=A0ABT6NTX9_9BACT|nr:hypothetical protein [Polyangium sorediatum]MDI1431767.1 hypothetical protein [Polyangium sorediatum]
MQNLLDPNPRLRSEAEWRALLGGLVESLSAFTGLRFEPTSWFVSDDQPGHACASNCVNVCGVVSPALRLEVCGVVCVTVNFGESARASCDLLLFVDGQRIRGPGALDFVFLPYGEAGWSSRGWVQDETGEWEATTTDARWRST